MTLLPPKAIRAKKGRGWWFVKPGGFVSIICRFAKIPRKDFANIVRKVAEGKTLTAAERARFSALAAGSNHITAYAKTQVELAHLLGVTRVTLNKWAKMDGL